MLQPLQAAPLWARQSPDEFIAWLSRLVPAIQECCCREPEDHLHRDGLLQRGGERPQPLQPGPPGHGWDGKYEYEHIFIDNSSKDNTVAILKSIAAQDKNVKVIVNARNFGHIRSPFHALLQARGDAVLSLVADLQDPPPMIAEMVRQWENGAYCVLGIKRTSEENRMMFWLRKQYYKLVERISSIETIQNFTGFGLYDRKVVGRCVLRALPLLSRHDR